MVNVGMHRGAATVFGHAMGRFQAFEDEDEDEDESASRLIPSHHRPFPLPGAAGVGALQMGNGHGQRIGGVVRRGFG